jgi:hypothetical protein
MLPGWDLVQKPKEYPFTKASEPVEVRLELSPTITYSPAKKSSVVTMVNTEPLTLNSKSAGPDHLPNTEMWSDEIDPDSIDSSKMTVMVVFVSAPIELAVGLLLIA